MMKRIVSIFLLVISFNALAFDVNSKLSGIWYNANQSGHGLNVVVLDENTTVVYWYVYHTDGTPMFLITVGQNTGNRIAGKTYYNTGMKFGDFDPNDIQETQWGTSTVTFNNCNSASLQYSSNVPGYGSGIIPMQRLASVSGLKCSDSPLHGTYSALVVEQGGTGIGIGTLFENGDMFYIAVNDSVGVVGVGQWRETGANRFAFDATVFSVFGGWSYISGSGTFNEDALEATFTDNGKLAATPIPSFQHSLDTSKMAGGYDIHDWNNTVIGTAIVQSNGNISAGTFTGCSIDGVFTVPNTNFNQAYVNADVSNCFDTVKITGSAVYNNSQKAIVILATDGWYGFVWTLRPLEGLPDENN